MATKGKAEVPMRESVNPMRAAEEVNHKDERVSVAPKKLGLERPRPVKIAYQGIVYKAGGRTILEDMNGVFGPAELVAIMGPSGAGKTTLLTLLTGQIQHFESGTILLNNEPLDPAILRKHSALVGQDNLLLGSLTPLDALTFAAFIKLGPHVPAVRKMQKVDALLKQFGLSECETTLVGTAGGAKGLSGGQQKRLAIALEMMSSPSLVFLDEPTSSLDSYSSMLVIDRLRLMAEHGHTVVSTIHQPSAAILLKFHTLLLLAKGGTVYFGPTSRLTEYFEMIGMRIPPNTNPADFAMEQVAGATAYVVGGMLEKYSKSPFVAFSMVGMREADLPNGMEEVDQAMLVVTSLPYPDTRYETSTGTQVRLMLWRAKLMNCQDLLMVRARVGSHVMVSLIVGGLYRKIENNTAGANQRITLGFFSLLFTSLASLLPTIIQFLPEKAVFIKEHRNNWYGSLAYFAAKTGADMPLLIMPPFVYGTIMFWLAGIGGGADDPDETGRWLTFTLILIVNAIIAQSLGMLICVAAPSTEVAIFGAPLSILPLLVFSGFFINVSDMSAGYSWIPPVNFMHWMWQAIMVAIFNELPLDCTPDEIRPLSGGTFFCPLTGAVYSSPSMKTELSPASATPWRDMLTVRLDLSANPTSIWVSLAIALAFMVLFRVWGYGMLKTKAKDMTLGEAFCHSCTNNANKRLNDFEKSVAEARKLKLQERSKSMADPQARKEKAFGAHNAL